MAEIIELLEKTDERIASLYAARSGREKETFEALMAQNRGNGRWLSPEEVVEAGLADKIIGEEDHSQAKGIFAKVKQWLSPSTRAVRLTETLSIRRRADAPSVCLTAGRRRSAGDEEGR
jgi:hypothetical protein